MLTDSSGHVGDAIRLEDRASKGKSGRVIYMSQKLKALLVEYIASTERGNNLYVIATERSEKFSPNAVAVFFKRLYSKLGYEGASSHSGRRTFITNCAKKISMAGGSIRDVMALAGHRNLATTQRYIEADVEAQRRVVALLY